MVRGIAMPPISPFLLAYAVPVVGALVVRAWSRRRTHEQAHRLLAEARADGLTEAPSLHPRIDLLRCIGCGGCVVACPERNVLGLVDGKAALVSPTECVGHAACKAACPTHAIEMVYGSPTRGMELPIVGDNFETSLPGAYIAGELGGVGLIRNAVDQGRRAVEAIAQIDRTDARAELDLIIVGAGPAGFAASLAATKRGLRYATLEQAELGGAVAHYPRGKVIMTKPAELPLVGKFHFREVSKEKLLAFWRGIEKDKGLRIRYDEPVAQVVPHAGGFLVQTAKAQYDARNILLAIGRRGTPRKLDVPGEELPKVVYRMIDPAQYTARHVLVVGGGNSALEAALAIAAGSAASVTLSYRGKTFARATPLNRKQLAAAVAAGRLRLALETHVTRIDPQSVELDGHAGISTLRNDDVVVCAGGVLAGDFLRSIGIRTETKYGTA
jgi:thioredoxin reductase/Pyruvate/2-oxoacid:ferredoxin oxidoreductase delta subunit